MAKSPVPHEIIDKICHFVARSGTNFDSRYELEILADANDTNSKHDLSSLRLASKATCEGANPHFFYSFDVRFPRTRTRRASAMTWRRKLLQFSQQPWIRHVRRLTLGFHASQSPDDGLQGNDAKDFLARGAYTIPSFVRACTRLQAVYFRVGSGDMSFETAGDPDWSRHLLLGMLETVLRECPQTLKILDIRLPLTCDFATLADSITQTPAVLKMMSQLEGLSVAVNDAPGRGIARYWPRSEPSNHRKFPNRDHQAGFWRFTQVAAKIQMLSVRGADHLNFNIGPMLCGGLRELSLRDVEVSSRKLRDVVERNLTELSAVELWRIELQSGTWAGVLTSFRSLPNLISFHMDSCGYMATGLSAHLRQNLLPEPDNPQAIETVSWHEDYPAPGALQRHVNGRRATEGLQLYGEHEYRYMDMFEL